MNASAIKKVIRLRFRRLKRRYTRIENKTGPEDIHHFRVEIKKIRAFLRMFRKDKNSKIKIPASLKEIYRKARTLRDLQLHHQTLKENENKTGIVPALRLKHVNKKTRDAIANLKKEMHPGLLAEARTKIEKKLPPGLSPVVIEAFYYKKLSAIRPIIETKLIADKQLHTIRKNIKDILYSAKTFEEDLKCRFPVRNWNSEKEKYYTDLAVELGKFQDSCIELTHFQHSPHHADPDEIKLINKLRLRKRLLKKQLVKLLKEKTGLT